MQTEIEAKFLDINVDELREKLKTLGVQLQCPECFMRRKNFDFPDRKMQKSGEWIRVRDEGNRITLSYKKLNDRTLHGTKEVCVVVDDFEKICSFLSALGYEAKSYQETKRETWIYDNCEITIDTWPWIPSFVEIEAPSEEKIKEVASLLGFDWKNAMHGSVETAYQKHYNFTEEEIDSWPEITFVPEPEWLLAKKIV